MKKDLAITFVTEGLVLLCGLLVYRLAKTHFGDDGFAVYALSRRTHSFLAPALLLGTTVAIPRFIAHVGARASQSTAGYFKAGSVLVAATTLLFALLMNLLPGPAARLLFGDASFTYLALPLTALMCGYIFHALNYAYFRGQGRMRACNLLQIANSALIPLAGIGIGRSTASALFFTGIAWIIANSLVFFAAILPGLRAPMRRSHLKEIFSFGVQRVPADFGAAALFGLPGVLTAHASGVTAAGHVAFSLSLLSMCGALFAPIGLVMLPKTSAAVARNDFAQVRTHLHRLILLSIGASLGLLITFELAADQILHFYLGRSAEPELVSITRATFLAAVPYAFYVSTRSIVDAVFTRSLNTVAIFIALAVFLGLYASGLTPSNSLIIALYTLGFAMAVINAQIYRLRGAAPEIQGT